MAGRRTRKTTSVIRMMALIGVGAAGAYAGWKAVQYGQNARKNRNLQRGKRILILGGGFAGAGVAQELARLLPHAADAQITLVDPRDYLLFTPMLTEAAGGEIDTRHIVHSLRGLSPRVTFLQGRADTVELENRRVTVTLGNAEVEVPTTTRSLDYDHLVIAVGSVTNYHHLPGVAEHSVGMKRLSDASTLLNRTLALLERADAEPDAATRRALLTFVVGGGGFTGVETMAALNDLVREAAKDYPHIAPEDIRTLLIEPGGRLLPELKAASLAAYAQHKMECRNIEVRLNTEIAGVGADYVQIKGGERIAAHTLVWAAGVQPNPLVASLAVQRGKHGGLLVDSCCRVQDHPGLWALGDCAEVPEQESHKTYAPTAQNATREGAQVARNIAATLRGEEAQPFVYTPIGELALVGRHTGVAEVYGLRFCGPLAWVMWRMVYWAKMPDSLQRIRILLDWTLDLIFGRNRTSLPARLLHGAQEAAAAPAPSKAGS